MKERIKIDDGVYGIFAGESDGHSGGVMAVWVLAAGWMLWTCERCRLWELPTCLQAKLSNMKRMHNSKAKWGKPSYHMHMLKPYCSYILQGDYSLTKLSSCFNSDMVWGHLLLHHINSIFHLTYDILRGIILYPSLALRSHSLYWG